jgi:hypothetical protein
MSQVKEDRPFRGPRALEKGDYRYVDESQGGVDRFTGVERILYQGREVYRLHYHGGRIIAQ